MRSESSDEPSASAGVLFVVATPIGNLGDLTERAAHTLRSVDRVLAEDTRRTRGLLTHLGITGKRLDRLDAHAREDALEAVVRDIAAGRSVALVTDAGVPGVSDPGAALLRKARAAAVRIVPIPGASALTTAISVCDFIDGPFSFLGFLPRRGKRRGSALARVASSTEPVVLFESPERIAATLAELALLAPDRRVMVARELTKLHEELAYGTLAELAAQKREWMGELTLIVDGMAKEESVESETDWVAIDTEIDARLEAGDHTRDIAHALAERLDLSRRELYARVELRKGVRSPS